jgi:D-alanine-D-alanine ligase
VWIALHGTYGEDGAVQGLLACLGLPYTGSGILASALAMDKVASKRIFESHQVPTPRWLVLDPGADTAAKLDLLTDWDIPLVVKPSQEGSSVGVSVVLDRADLAAALDRAAACHGPTLIEQYIPGAELHVGVLDGQVLGSIEVRPAKGFYDYEAKYQRDDTQYLIPAPIPEAHLIAGEAAARAAYTALDCTGHGRVDLRIDADGAPFVLEVNTLPGMTSHSLLPKIAAHAGMDYATLCERILATAHL